MAKVVALTGGVGAGKTEASKVFASLGVPVVDLDEIAHRLSQPDSAPMQALRAQFGADFFNAEGLLDRAKLREWVFSQPEALNQLNDIMHPAIYQQALHDIQQHQSSPYVVLAIPLLVESTRYQPHIDHVLVIDCDEETQVERVMKRSGLSQLQAEAIMNAQSSREARLALSDTVILNTQTPAELQKNIIDFHHLYLKTCI